MKKLILAITTILTLASAPAMAQVFMDDEDMNRNRGESAPNEFGVMVPSTNVQYDQYQYAPMGEGLVVLAGLAGAYLLGKRKKED